MRLTRHACNFCGKTQDEVEDIILGPGELAICGECVRVCAALLNGTAGPRVLPSSGIAESAGFMSQEQVDAMLAQGSPANSARPPGPLAGSAEQ